jgi:hypothetical protein
MRKLYNTLKVVGALALAGCGAGQIAPCPKQIQRPESHSLDRAIWYEEGISRKDGRVYAVGCFSGRTPYNNPSQEEKVTRATGIARNTLRLNSVGLNTDLDNVQDPDNRTIRLERVEKIISRGQLNTCVQISMPEEK